MSLSRHVIAFIALALSAAFIGCGNDTSTTTATTSSTNVRKLRHAAGSNKNHIALVVHVKDDGSTDVDPGEVNAVSVDGEGREVPGTVVWIADLDSATIKIKELVAENNVRCNKGAVHCDGSGVCVAVIDPKLHGKGKPALYNCTYDVDAKRSPAGTATKSDPVIIVDNCCP
jgi:hypothetical protein